MTETLKNKSADAIIELFMKTADYGTAAEADALFVSLKDVPAPTRAAVMNELEKRISKQGQDEVREWKYYQDSLYENYGLFSERKQCDDMWDDCSEGAEREKLSNLGYKLRPMAKMLQHIAKVKGDQADPWTESFAQDYNALSAAEKKSVDKLIEVFESAGWGVRWIIQERAEKKVVAGQTQPSSEKLEEAFTPKAAPRKKSAQQKVQDNHDQLKKIAIARKNKAQMSGPAM
jgi:hypothetical protein